jgi:hypothetical protein
VSVGKAAVLLGALLLALSGCASEEKQSDSAAPAPAPKPFVEHVDNPWFPLVPGTTYVYRGMKDGEPSREVLRVTHRTKVIQGVRCTVLEDRLFLSGRLEERTTDWYAQDVKGNVWYFGEVTAELDKRGRVKSREGSWQAGVDGAKAGIFMPAEPKVGESFRQEYYEGHAEDHFRVEDLAASVSVPYTSSKEALLTKEWTPLEPRVVDHKYYVRGIGTVKEQSVKGGDELNELVSVTAGLEN